MIKFVSIVRSRKRIFFIVKIIRISNVISNSLSSG